MEEDGEGEGEERKAAARWGVNRMDGGSERGRGGRGCAVRRRRA